MKISEIKQIGIRAEQGAWVDLADFPGVSVNVRGFGNSGYSARLAQIAKGYTQEQLDTEDVRKEIQTVLFVENILLDWKGIDDLPYSREAADTVLRDTSPEMKHFQRAIENAANNVARIGRERLEDDAKNSSPSSAGSSPTE